MKQLKGSDLTADSVDEHIGSARSHRDRSQQIRGSQIAILLLALGVAGCEKPAAPVNPEIAWTSAALSRNPDLDVLATDPAAGVFTVRIKSTGEVNAVRLADIAAAPISQLAVETTPAFGAVDESAPVTEPAPALSTSERPPAQSMAAKPAIAATEATPAESSNALPAPAVVSKESNYTIDRAGGQVKVSGPGVSIVSAGNKIAGTAAGSDATSTEPLICEGKRLLHLDNRTINAEGDGVIARGGCELYITNSRIIAAGTAVTVNDAVVHIANSTIEGGAASLDADDRARLLVRSSTFKGLQRRSEHASIQDQGGNQWH